MILKMEELEKYGITEDMLTDPEYKRKVTKRLDELREFLDQPFSGTYREAFMAYQSYQEVLDVLTSIQIQIIIREPEKLDVDLIIDKLVKRENEE